ncbi:hypothetical protein A2Y99_00810 [Candidatus Gottesmanbacteria bacterium RBG_13_37_7]|uniref:Uncharacterized protein n=1 Tax=Candidatus Gottesmanbacteria bacterium RBG_13_37_7 TaxID=1798369 RepID=A0A1F5YJJ6_9BACT|nr:MAG: hypothetical protein A2Y99_00810 [Candidatus Gottesmanbacteria bacterium RBG_13_37_7]
MAKNILRSYLENKTNKLIGLFSKTVVPSKLFPHFIRTIPERISIVRLKEFIFLFMLLILLSNLFPEILLTTYQKKSLENKILVYPFYYQYHFDLANQYLGINETEAEKEFLLAQFLFQSDPNKRTIGKLTPYQYYQNIKNKKTDLIAEISKWEDYYRILPDYQFIALKLAALNIQIGDKNKASYYINQLLINNPIQKDALDLKNKLETK